MIGSENSHFNEYEEIYVHVRDKTTLTYFVY